MSSCAELEDEPDTRRGVKRRWSTTELDIFHKRFHSNLLEKKMATATELREALTELPNRTTAQIRVRLNNVILGKQK